MTSLSTRIASAEVGSRELDFWIAYELGLLSVAVTKRPARIKDEGAEFSLYGDDGKRAGWIGHHCYDRLTTSLDAALALAERLGWPFWSGGQGTHNAWAHLYDRHPNDDGPTINAQAKTPALALCAAILKAVESEK